VQGLGRGPAFFIPLTTATLSRIPSHRLADASSLSNFMRNLFRGLRPRRSASPVWDNRATYHHAVLTESVTHASAATRHYLDVLHGGGAEFRGATWR